MPDASLSAPPIAPSPAEPGLPERAGGAWPAHRVMRIVWLAVLVAAVVLHGVLAWVTRSPGIMTTDETVYAALAQSLLDGGYREWYTVEAPPHVLYPPITPLLLAIAGAVGGFSQDTMLAVPVLLSTAAVALILVATRHRLAIVPAIGVAALLATNPVLLRYAGRPISEAPALFFVALTLWALAPEHPSRRRRMLAGAAVLAACLTRSAMIPMLGAVWLLWVWRRQWRSAANLALAAAVTLGAWFFWTRLHRGTATLRSYADDAPRATEDRGIAAEMAERVVDNTMGYGERLASDVVAVTLPGVVDDLLVIALLVGGAVLLLVRRRWPLVPLMLGAYGALLLIWAWPVPRFLHPAIPLLVVATAAGMLAVVRRVPTGGGWRDGTWANMLGVPTAVSGGILLAPMLLAAAVQARPMVWRALELRKCDRSAAVPADVCYIFAAQQHADYFRVVDRIRSSTGPAEGVLAAKPAAIAWHLGRLSSAPAVAFDRPPDETAAYLTERGITLVLLARLSELDQYALGPALAGFCEELRVVEQREHALLLALPASRAPVSAAATADACAAVAAHMAAYAE